MTPQERLSADERRDAIVQASIPLFAQLGVNGVTTRQLAEAAGVSEALLYRYFPSKEALYGATQACCVSKVAAQAERIAALESSTSTFVIGVYFMVSKIILGHNIGTEDHRWVKRLLLNSILEDGEFCRGFLRHNVIPWFAKMEECLQVAEREGDLVPGVKPVLRLWLAHHMPVIVGFFRLPAQPVVDYGVGPQELVEQVCRFVLLGVGLTAGAIDRHLNASALSMFTR